jgi:hypothetical protein
MRGESISPRFQLGSRLHNNFILSPPVHPRNNENDYYDYEYHDKNTRIKTSSKDVAC